MSNPRNKITPEGIKNMKKEIVGIINSMPEEFKKQIHEVFPTKNTY